MVTHLAPCDRAVVATGPLPRNRGGLLIRLLYVFEFIATHWVFSTVFWKSFVFFSCCGSCPVRCVLCCLSDGKMQIWLGDLRLAVCFWFVFWLFRFAKLHVTTGVHVIVFLLTASSHARTEP